MVVAHNCRALPIMKQIIPIDPRIPFGEYATALRSRNNPVKAAINK
jgi:hypothetical protein